MLKSFREISGYRYSLSQFLGREGWELFGFFYIFTLPFRVIKIGFHIYNSSVGY